LPASQREVIRKLIEDFGISHIYPEDMFYKVHKISRADFLAKLEGAQSGEEREKIILGLYDDEAQQGRRGILSLPKSIKIVKKKIEEREKFEKFAKKYGQ